MTDLPFGMTDSALNDQINKARKNMAEAQRAAEEKIPRPIRCRSEEDATELAYLQVEEAELHFVVGNDQGGCDVVLSNGIGPDVVLYRFVS